MQWHLCIIEMQMVRIKAFFDILLGAIIVYDTTNKQTFKKVQIWIEELKEHSNNSNIVIIIAGN